MRTAERAPVAYDPAKPSIDVLPERNGHRLAITWLAATTDDTPQAGFLTIDAPNGSTTYSVTESPASIGRSFYLSKLLCTAPTRKGTQPGAEGYIVEATAGGVGDRCECRGWQSRGTCRHLDSIRALIANGWI